MTTTSGSASSMMSRAAWPPEASPDTSKPSRVSMADSIRTTWAVSSTTMTRMGRLMTLRLPAGPGPRAPCRAGHDHQRSDARGEGRQHPGKGTEDLRSLGQAMGRDGAGERGHDHDAGGEGRAQGDHRGPAVAAVAAAEEVDGAQRQH